MIPRNIPSSVSDYCPIVLRTEDAKRLQDILQAHATCVEALALCDIWRVKEGKKKYFIYQVVLCKILRSLPEQR